MITDGKKNWMKDKEKDANLVWVPPRASLRQGLGFREFTLEVVHEVSVKECGE